MQDCHSRVRIGPVGSRFLRISAGILAVALVAGCAEPRPLQEIFAAHCRESGLVPDTPAFSECMRQQTVTEQKRRTYQYIQRHVIDSRPRGP